MSQEHCFCMITPDALIQKKENLILKQLVDSDIIIEDFEIKYLTDKEIEEIYKITYLEKVESKRQTHWWLTKKVYCDNPAIGLVVSCKKYPSNFSNIYEYINYIKGSNNIKEVASDNIRKKNGVYFKTLALFHSSDSITAHKRESKIFFKRDKIKNKEFNINDVSEALQNYDYTKYNPFFALACLKLKILYYLEKKIKYEIGCNLFLTKYFKVFNEEKEFFSKSNDIRNQKDALEKNYEICKSIKDTFESLSVNNDQNYKLQYDYFSLNNLGQILGALCNYKEYNNLNFDYILQILEINHIPISKWEIILIENLLYFY